MNKNTNLINSLDNEFKDMTKKDIVKCVLLSYIPLILIAIPFILVIINLFMQFVFIKVVGTVLIETCILFVYLLSILYNGFYYCACALYNNKKTSGIFKTTILEGFKSSLLQFIYIQSIGLMIIVIYWICL